MATKRTSAHESNRNAASDARADKLERRPTPRKRTDAPAKAQRPGKIERVPDAGLPPKPDASGAVRSRTSRPLPSSASVSTSSAFDSSEPAASEATDEKERRPRKRAADGKKRRRKWPFVAVGAVLVVVLATGGLLSWDRWYRYDDAADVQGEWQVHGSTGVVVIDGQSIKLTEDVTWSYTMDTASKTISYTFGNMQGQGRYRFSLDRSQLVIMDGSEYTWASTLLDDIAWMADQSLRALQGQGPEEAMAGDGVIVVDRLSRDGSALPRAGVATASGAPEAGAESATGDATGASALDDAPDESSASGEGDAQTGSAADAVSGEPEPPAPDEALSGSADESGVDAGSPVSPGAAFEVSDRSA